MSKFKLLIVCIISIYTSNIAKAGGDNHPSGARSAALGHASVALGDIWSTFNNQAGLASLTRSEWAFYSENRFLMKELGYGAMAYALPVSAGTFAFSASYFGFSAYNDSKLGLAYARNFGDNLSFGVQFDYMMSRQGEPYGNRNFMTFEAGILAKASPKLTLGAHIYNPLSVKYAGYNNEKTPVILRLGASYVLSDKIRLLAETEKGLYSDPTLNAGIEYTAAKWIVLRGGLSSGPSTVSFGGGFIFGNFTIDVSSSYHTILGYSPQFSLSYRF